MPARPPFRTFALASTLLLASAISARGLVWDYLGYTQMDGRQDHAEIRILRSDKAFRVIGLRLAGQAIFLDRIVVHLAGGGLQEFAVSGRILPGGADYILHLAGEAQPLEKIEIRYFRESWEHAPRVTVYGVAETVPGAEAVTP